MPEQEQSQGPTRAIVTGGAKGIGSQIASALVARGDKVVIIDRDDQVARTADAIGAGAQVADLANHGAATAAVGRALDTLGGIDLLVNNAGIFDSTPLLQIDPAEWDHMFAVNVRAMLGTIQAAAPTMAAGGGGAIVNMASMGGKVGEPGQAAYAASKAAVIGFTRVAAMELGPMAITVNCICPGYVLTEMGEGQRTEEQVAAWTAKSPLGRLASPDDVAAHVLFLSSPGASYVTGQALNVTGGMFMS